MRHRQVRALGQRPPRGAQPGFAPAAQRQPHLMPPVVRFQRHRPPERGQRIVPPAGPLQHEAERGPRLGQVRAQATGVLRMRRGQPQGVGVRRRVGAGGLELHHAGVGHADVVRRLTRVLLEQSLERGPGAADPIALERLQGGAAFGPGPMRRQQQLQVRFALWVVDRGDGRDELIPVPRHGLDVAVPVAGVQATGAADRSAFRGCCPPRQCRPTRRR